MGTSAAAGAGSGRAPAVRGQVRGRILEAGSRLLYAEGIRAVSADRVIAAAGVSKVTFYRHFPSKDDLVVAYLQELAAAEREQLERLRAEHVGDAPATLGALAAALGDVARGERFRGCAFVNAGAEFADPSHPVRRAVAAHRAWYAGFFTDVARDAGADDPRAAAAELMMLRDGAMVCGDVDDADAVEPRLSSAFGAVLAAHRRATSRA
ncbi:TetR/AcrR family transcriptional regulator [Krasilnikoviella flava]|uniref:Transcriptional regulator, TetR family n=1 Tax=Krasilnikoviella flava TaxID=526729 RepID=A0A1T5L5W2_9MICO|nr:TetR/AcrR family transcriptional regulator [Krasilnikoviella flava]SKC70778.1 transcriptional regulator, TetR family [Krasilnikoviella flava]